MITLVFHNEDRSVTIIRVSHPHMGIREALKPENKNKTWFMFDSETNKIILTSKMVNEYNKNEISSWIGFFITATCMILFLLAGFGVYYLFIF